MSISFNGGQEIGGPRTTITVTRSGGGIFLGKKDDAEEKPEPKPVEKPEPPPPPPQPVRVCGTVVSLVGDTAKVRVETKSGGTKIVTWRVDNPNFSGNGARICAVITGRERELPTGSVEQPAGLC
jgi:hypothetical protein